MFGLLLIFGHYPMQGIPGDTIKIEIYVESVKNEPILILESKEDLEIAKRTSRWVWVSAGFNSLEGPQLRKLVIIREVSHRFIRQSITFTPYEWDWHGRTPKKFMTFLNRKLVEKKSQATKSNL